MITDSDTKSENIITHHPYSGEDHLLAALKEEDLGAFEYLYKSYRYWMLLEAFVILKNDLAAQDLVQDLMIDFWSYKLYNKITSNLKGYLLTAVRNRAFNYVRDARRREQKLAGFLQIHLHIPVEEQDKAELNASLERAIKNLPPKTRIIFIQFYMHGLSHKKIAEVMNISPNTVNNHIENARKQIRKKFKKT